MGSSQLIRSPLKTEFRVSVHSLDVSVDQTKRGSNGVT